MAKVTGGESLYWRGKKEDTVYYMLNGQMLCRGIGKKKKKAEESAATLGTWQVAGAAAAVHNSMKEFIAVGYRLAIKEAKQNYYSPYMQHFQEVVAGNYPNQYVDYTKLRVTEGSMPMVAGAAVALNETGLTFSWNPESQLRGMHYTDKVMMLAFFPELSHSCYMIAGAERHVGQDTLELRSVGHGYTAQVYIAFIENNQQSVSNSAYLGELIW